MKLLLLGINPALCDAWRTAFAGLTDVTVHQARFQSLIGSFDCLVSPANSFGLMDGGMDADITSFFGVQLETRVQDEIWRVYRGQQPIGTCLMVPTHHPRCPWLAHCPTMTVPMEIEGTSNAYAALLAALTNAAAAGVHTLACPGLGTGAGAIPPEVAALQMRYAYDLWRGPRVYPRWSWTTDHLWRTSGLPRNT